MLVKLSLYGTLSVVMFNNPTINLLQNQIPLH
uniref:Uncharacterized protein n=1 Tax=Rhizophora mucronata TaxID=61149 RepID=A0A2P2PKB4_RHIMU